MTSPAPLYDIRIVMQSAIVAALRAAGAQNVFEEYRNPESMEQLLADYNSQDNGYIETWLVLCTARDPRPINRQQINWFITFDIELFWGYKQAESEPMAQRRVDGILEAFRGLRSLGGWSSDKPLRQRARIPVYMNGMIPGVRYTFELTLIGQSLNVSPV